MKSSLNGMDQVEDRISGLENKAGELDHSIKENDLEENSRRQYAGTFRYHVKTNTSEL